MKIKRWLASFLAVSILLGANPGKVAMAEGLDTESAITHKHTDSCYRLEENCIHNHTGERYPTIESIPEEASLSDAQYSEPTDMVISEGTTGTQILYEKNIHYIIDPNYPNHKIPLFCMNNALLWPHHTENMGQTPVPEYTDGYLTPENFKSQKEYDECMRRLSKLLYAGYPYNGEHLYQIVSAEDSKKYAPTE
ncbi:hypothetical protein, secreted, partial [gut metagenome]